MNQSNHIKKVLLIAGEESGDQHASMLVRELLSRCNKLLVFACGANHLKNAGAELIQDMTEYAVNGIAEVLKRLPSFWKLERRLHQWVEQNKPDLAILVDFPGFNLRLLPFLARHMPVLYFIPPKVWVWRQSRAAMLCQHCARIYTIFPFETEFYPKKALYYGNPLLDALPEFDAREDSLRLLGLNPQKKYIGLLPGSRQHEIRSMLPVYLQTARELTAIFPELDFILPQVESVPPACYQAIKNFPLPLHVIKGHSHASIAACEFVLATSGTVTLEAALLSTPMIICYQAGILTGLVYRALVKTKYVGLPNLLLQQELCPEFLQGQAIAKNLLPICLNWLKNPALLAKQREGFLQITQKMGQKGVFSRIASDILEGFIL